MERGIAGSDWKLFRKLRETALERFSERVLQEVERIRGQPGKSWRTRYLDIYRLIQERDREPAFTFNNPRRSAAIMQLTEICAQSLLPDEEFQQFGVETRHAVESMLLFRRSCVGSPD